MDEEASPRRPYFDGDDDPIVTESSEANDYSTFDMADDPEKDDTHPSVEIDGDSMPGEGTDRYSRSDDGEQAYVGHTELDDECASHISDATPRVGDDDESSSQHEGTDEDVFTDKSPRSSIGSYDASSESGKGADIDNMTTITRSPRISDISQYDKEEFIPTARGTPRPPFRTPSDVRAMQMSSPAGSVVGSPRSSRKHFPTGSRLGTPSASAQYSPKRRSTPPRFKSRLEAPLVLLHVTLLPLRWVWGDLVNNMDPDEMSEQAKTLRNSWRILQDRVGDTVIERGILLGHPQNDYEVLEERLLEALDLPVHRRARILECGHYLGPSNEATLTEGEESEDDYSQNRRQSASKRHWCATCKSEIRYDALGEVKVFRVKVYASNGLMRAGAWEACWKEMERVDVELEPIVEPAVQDEIVRLAAVQQEREVAQQEEANIAKEVEMQFEEQRQAEERLKQQTRSESQPSPESKAVPEAAREPRHESRPSRRRQRDEERLRETYGQASPESHTRVPSAHRHRPSSQSSDEVNKGKESRRREYQSASFSELLLQSARVLMQDRKNVIIATLSLFVLILSLRAAPPEPPYEPIIHRQKTMAEMQHHPVVDVGPSVQDKQSPLEVDIMEPIEALPSLEIYDEEPAEPSPIYIEASPSYESSSSEPSVPISQDSVLTSQDSVLISQDSIPISEDSITDEPKVTGVESKPMSESMDDTLDDTLPEPTSISTIYNPCQNSASSLPSAVPEASSAVSNGCPTVQEPARETAQETARETAQETVQETVQECVQETVQETVQKIETTTERKVVKVIQTITQTQTETQTEIEMATAIETVVVQATEIPQIETSANIEEKTIESQEDTVLVEDKTINDENAENTAVPTSAAESVAESAAESATEPAVEPTVEPVVNPVPKSVPDCVVVEAIRAQAMDCVEF
ncbi:hypothetical protein ONZ43_g6001 [Nemania bipapillata]|uniref:Uncharacterized protein n=1 Tax=Nemania bipapillata TaxID=110536 RepID=A0ACC2I455_9PEZI|nr:hypothetical protein ONZ43_g6001 [Nemania bipapillata]